LIPWIKPLPSTLRISLERASTIRIKRKGDRGSPCLNPLKELKNLNGDPPMRIKKRHDGDILGDQLDQFFI
jgi:hypothetical protein